MRLAASFVGESVENGIGGRSKLETEPGGGSRLLLDERQAAQQKGLDILFLAGFGFKTNVQSEFDHGATPWVKWGQRIRFAEPAKRCKGHLLVKHSAKYRPAFVKLR